MDAFSATLAIKALDALSLRAEVTAANIANAGTPNYRPQSVRFEDALRAAANDGADALAQLQPVRSSAARGWTGPELRLDQELATAASTASRYAALVEIVNRRLQIEGLAVSGGR